MRSPGGGPILRGVGGVVEEGNMAHALRGWVTASVLFCFDLVYVLGKKNKRLCERKKDKKGMRVDKNEEEGNM